ncbi:alpha/beta hydrolase [Paenibacillus lutrae]|uniref:Alpha/beta fold hydrolase n=1 Tax=Paenibacillus lutrae TaxID=2078573 RepID=A0A7X3JYB3_9BACL|nr:alpha/beta hydrolase [Paenibacillus lutrae]MVO98764.1 alpha/beta fold hydrolase [Paenibacillus lutrae]
MLLQLEDAITIHYKEDSAADQALEVLVFIHDLGLDLTVWDEIIGFFKGHYRIVLYDLRGHGRSTGEDSEAGWSVFVDDLHLLMERLGIRRAHIAGHGGGAVIAVQFCSSYPGMVEKLILISIPVKFPAALMRAKIAERKKLAGEGRLSLAEELAAFTTALPDSASAFRIVRDLYSNMNTDLYFRAMDMLLREDGWKELKRISHRTLVLAGEYDPLYVTSASLAASRLPDASFLIVPDSAYLPFLEQPGTTASWIRRFLQTKQTRAVSDSLLVRDVRGTLQLFLDEGEKKVELAQMLKVNLLGSFQVILNGQEKPDGWNQRYAKSLLLYMIFHPTASREELCDALFPQVPSKTAMRNIKVYLHYFKRMMQAQEGGAPILSVDREHVMLRCVIRCDLLDFLAEIKDLHHADAARKYESAGRLLGNLPDPLLPGIYDEWFMDRKSRLEMEVAELAVWMEDQEKRRGRHQRAEGYRRIARRFLHEEEKEPGTFIQIL